MTLATTRLLLRPFQLNDIAAVHSYAGNEENTRYLYFGTNGYAETEAFVRCAIASAEEHPQKNFQFAVILKETGELIGNCGLTIRGAVEAEIGWTLHRNYWKHGYGTELGAELLRFGFSDCHLHRLYANCDTENEGSYRVMERNGMRREGCFRKTRPARESNPRKWRDEYQYAILEEEWFASQKGEHTL